MKTFATRTKIYALNFIRWGYESVQLDRLRDNVAFSGSEEAKTAEMPVILDK